MLPFVLVLSSCMEEIQIAFPSMKKKAVVSFSVKVTPSFSKETTKSFYTLDENAINDYFLLIYDEEGDNVFSWSSLTDTSTPEATLVVGRTYNVYCVANKGSFSGGYPREEDIKAFTTSVTDLRQKRMVMTAHSTLIPTASTNIELTLKRCVAKISVTVQSDYFEFPLNNTGTLTSMALRNAPAEYYPFDKTRKSSQYVNGDAQVEAFSFGDTIDFYCLENMQGTLLPDNTDPWKKTPENIGEMAGSCTYITFTLNDKNLISGPITYNFYLGSDTTTNFDVKENTSYLLKVNLMNDLYKSSWQITAGEFGYQPGKCSPIIIAGHYVNDMYVGEGFEVSMDIMNQLVKFLGGDITSNNPKMALEVRAFENGVEVPDALVQTSEWEWSMVDEGITGMSHCLSSLEWRKTLSNAELYLTDSHGTKITLIEDGINVSYPQLCIYSESSVSKNSVSIVDDTPEIKPYVNVGSTTKHYYLVDKNGHNIETTASSFNRELYNEMDLTCVVKPSGFVTSTLLTPEVLLLGSYSDANKFFSRKITRYSEKYKPIFSIEFSASNDGSSATKSDALSKIYGCSYLDDTHNESLFSTVVTLGELQCVKGTTFEISSIDIEIVDASKWIKYSQGSQVWICVSNPSNISIKTVASLCAVNKNSEDFKRYSRSSGGSLSPYKISTTATEYALASPYTLSQPLVGYAEKIILNTNYDSEKDYTDTYGYNELLFHSYCLFRNFGANKFISLNSYYLSSSVDISISSLSGQSLPLGYIHKNLPEAYTDGVSYEAALGVWENGNRTHYLTSNTDSDAGDITKRYPDFSPEWVYSIVKSPITDFVYDEKLGSPCIAGCTSFTRSDLEYCMYYLTINASCTYREGPSTSKTQYYSRTTTDGGVNFNLNYVTLNYWHESYHTLIATSSNISATMAKVDDITLNKVKITTSGGWYPIDFNNARANDFTVTIRKDQKCFYKNTLDGSAPDSYSVNPDGSSRRSTSVKYKNTGEEYITNSYTPDPFSIRISSDFLDNSNLNFWYYDPSWAN